LIAETHVKVGNEVFQVRPALLTRPGEHAPELQEFPIGWTGMNLVLASADSDHASAAFHLVPAPREFLYAELSLKPFISLLWIGSGLTMLGLILATAYRFRLANLSAKAQTEAESKPAVRPKTIRSQTAA